MPRPRKKDDSKPQSKRVSSGSSADFLRLYQKQHMKKLASITEIPLGKMSQVLRGGAVTPDGFRYTLEPRHGIPPVVVSYGLPEKCRRARGDSSHGIIEVAEFEGCYITSRGKIDKKMRRFRLEHMKGGKLVVYEIPLRISF